ncbi:MAG: hypothetical protein C3F02_03410 [Parcubacteria group bacterium]|nr:MAG: hypothetical protein C3F02_03410 [Parcubacteria group bacterium]
MFFRLLKIKKHYNRQVGFTFLEMLISVFLLALMTVAVSGVYVSFTSLQARARSYERLLNDSYYAIELMAREFRTTAIFDYTPSDTCTSLFSAPIPDACIIFINDQDKLEAFLIKNDSLYFVTPTCKTDFSSCTWWEDNPQNYTVLLSPSLNGIKVTNLRFKIFPTSDPFASDSDNNNQQPRVTMSLQTRYPSQNIMQDVFQYLQTTVSARIYRR